MIQIFAAVLALALLFGGVQTYRLSEEKRERVEEKAALDRKAREAEEANEKLAARIKKDEENGQLAFAEAQRLNAAAASAGRSIVERVRFAAAAASSVAPPNPGDPCAAQDARLRAVSELLSEGAGLVEEGRELVLDLNAKVILGRDHGLAIDKNYPDGR